MKTALLRTFVSLLDLPAGPYRTLTHRNAPPGFLAWLGIFAGVPMSALIAPTDEADDRRGYVLVGIWFTMAATGLIQTVAAWRWRGTPRFWLARAEETFMFVLAAATWYFGCLGAAVFLLAGGLLNLLRSKLIELGIEPYNDAVTPIRLVGVPLQLFAGSYRAIAFKFGTFGGKRGGLITWLGILLAYPIFIDAWPPDWAEGTDYDQFRYISKCKVYAGWITLGLAAYIQMMVRWCSTQPQPDEACGHSWAGSWEPFLASALALGANSFICPGAAYFIATGYLCSLAHIGLTRLQRRIEAWSEEDTERVNAIVHAGTSRTKVAATAVGGGLISVSLFSSSFAVSSLGAAWGFLKSLRRKPVEGQVAYKPPSFTSRVGSHIVAHFAISMILGTVGIGFLFKCFAIILAIPLWLFGWKVEAPPDVQHETRGFFSRMADGMRDKAHDAREYIHDRREQASEAWDEKQEELSNRAAQIGRRAEAGYERGKEVATEKAQGIATKAVSKAVWGN